MKTTWGYGTMLQVRPSHVTGPRRGGGENVRELGKKFVFDVLESKAKKRSVATAKRDGNASKNL